MSSVLGSPLLDAIMILCPFILVGIERLTHTWLVSPSALMWFAGLFSMGHFVPGFVRCYEDETLF